MTNLKLTKGFWVLLIVLPLIVLTSIIFTINCDVSGWDKAGHALHYPGNCDKDN